jgi:THO complex subunit 4
MYAHPFTLRSDNSCSLWLQELFRRIGTVVRLQLRYDRAGRSEGTAYVTYELKEDAQEAVRQFDGANANGTRAILALQAL